MSDYKFFANYMRFVAGKMPSETSEIVNMMDELGRVASEIEVAGEFSVSPDKLEHVARALAGLAGFLQQQILPEVVADNNIRGEAQVRWVIDTSMELMGNLTVRAESGDHDPSTLFQLPPPPT